MDKKQSKKSIRNKFILFLICISTLTMSIGYAAMNSISLDINGEVIATAQEGVYITEVNYVNDFDGNLNDSKIINIYQSNMNSNIVLGENNNSKITYEVTLYNSNDKDYYYYDTEYILCDESDLNCVTYSNENIKFDVTIFNGNVIKSKDYLTFNITFSYLNGYVEGMSNVLKSILNFKFIEFPCPNDGRVCDLSGNNYHATVIGANWDKDNRFISFDGIDDYMYLDSLKWNNTPAFTIDFVAKIGKNNTTNPIILFETSINSNLNYGSYYIDTNEFGENEITLAMKYNNTSNYDLINHKYVNNIIDNNNYRHYTITFNSLNEYDNFTKIYYEGIYQTTTTHLDKEGEYSDTYKGNISGKTLSDYAFYVASRAGNTFFAKMDLKEVRIYNKALSDEEIIKNHNDEIVKDALLVHWDFR